MQHSSDKQKECQPTRSRAINDVIKVLKKWNKSYGKTYLLVIPGLLDSLKLYAISGEMPDGIKFIELSDAPDKEAVARIEVASIKPTCDVFVVAKPTDWIFACYQLGIKDPSSVDYIITEGVNEEDEL